jgi:N-acetylglucosaminyl-diphospho-decaprenol L-rhamnosyltransferase
LSTLDRGKRRMSAMAIVTHDSVDELRRLFAGQLELARGLGMRLAVVDNASKDGSVEYLREARERFPQLILSFQARNLGYAGAVNVAFSLLSADDVLLINPDVEPTEDAVLELVDHMAANPKVAICAPRLLFRDGELQPSARRPASLAAMIGSLGAGSGIPPLRRSYERYLDPAGSGTGAVDWVIGAAMLIRRLAFDEVGGFDQGFFLYMEDADFCRRCARAGWGVSYLPSTSMEHEYGRASSARDASVVSSPARRRHVASLARYWLKHPGALIGREARRNGRGPAPNAEPYRPR